MPAMQLIYLDFDYSEDDEGTGLFDALATVNGARWPALQAEAAAVLAWAHAHFPDGPAPVEDGGSWSHDLHARQELTVPVAVRFDAERGTLETNPGTPDAPRHTLGLSISGTAAFCAALREAFGLE